ncbi:helix-turn-helix domain-containing protein [Aquimarina sp. TRL1]|uniref:helix-turn-helix domain-containing protein n=1 Tax=Aquimarina sp. (strain TRL1) TaxID=2736252 RepID=UPI00158F392B|nr:helix-turn-helix domain-containing protein [Aquimarina sp. TRL1]QKX03856.1 helix-turn-helix domain-containing protein [Aquimarina sp. TRL1]
MTLLYSYAIRTTGVYLEKERLHYIPAIIEFLVFSIFCVIVSFNPDFHEILLAIKFMELYSISATIYILIMCVLIIKINKLHRIQLPHFYKDIKYKSLLWLTIFCFICIVFNFITTIRFFFLPESNIMFVLYQSFSLLSLYYITIASLVQINIINMTTPDKKTISKEGDEKEELEHIFQTIDAHLKTHKSYLNPSINLKKFSKEIHIPERLISKAINTVEHKNFNNYVNYYRIEEFKTLIGLEKYQKYSIAAIAHEVGFNSRASFYKNFKEMVGISPSDYVSSLKNPNKETVNMS